MGQAWTRRGFVELLSGATVGWAAVPGRTQSSPGADLPAGHFPAQDPAAVREVVTVSHANLERVRELVEARPALARAAWDWGFGDWETALGAASHTGQRAIAELLLSHGARPTIFSAAMLGQLSVVRAFVEATPGIQRTKGPHGITLLSHARAGGAPAAQVVSYLESIDGADDRPALAPLPSAERDALVGTYAFGPGSSESFAIDVSRDQLGILRPGGTRRVLFHLGDLVFFPTGAEAVRVEFAGSAGRASSLTVRDGSVAMTARRID